MRIVSLLASGTQFVCALGCGEMLVGRSHECDDPAWVKSLPVCTSPAFDVTVPSGQIDAEVRRRLKAGEPLYHVHTDLIRELRPDLLITQAHCQVCAVTPGDVDGAGCDVLAPQVLALTAGTVAGIYEGAMTLAGALDRQQAGAELIADMQRRIDTVTERVGGRESPTVVMLEWIDPIFAMGNWGPELLKAANARPLLGKLGQHSQAIPWDSVREADPDYLIIAPCGFDVSRTLREMPTLEALPGWPDLRAVRTGQVVVADGNKFFNRSGTSIAQTVEIIAEIIHGDGVGRHWQPFIAS